MTPSTPAPLGGFDKSVCAEVFDGIGIAHQHDRRARVRPAKFVHHLQAAAQPDTVADAAFGRALDYRAVGHRIGKRHAQLEDVGTGAHQFVQKRNGQIGARIAPGDIRDQPRAAARAQLREAGADAPCGGTGLQGRAHGVAPRPAMPALAPISFMPPASATICRSLSPRPLRLTSRILSLDNRGASCVA